MAHGHGLVQQNMTVDAQALSTLAGRTALILNSVQSNLTTAFLLKRVRYWLQLTGRTQGDDGPLVVGICRGDATTSEIQNAMLEANSAGPEDITQMLQQDDAWVVYQNTVTPLIYRTDDTSGQPRGDWISFSPKGIPALEGSGFSMFLFNCGSGALTTGSTLNGIAHVQGVWLRG